MAVKERLPAEDLSDTFKNNRLMVWEDLRLDVMRLLSTVMPIRAAILMPAVRSFPLRIGPRTI